MRPKWCVVILFLHISPLFYLYFLLGGGGNRHTHGLKDYVVKRSWFSIPELGATSQSLTCEFVAEMRKKSPRVFAKKKKKGVKYGQHEATRAQFSVQSSSKPTFLHYYVCVCTCMYQYVCIHIYMYIYLYCICFYICICGYTYIWTHRNAHFAKYEMKANGIKVHAWKRNCLGRPEGLSVLELCWGFFCRWACLLLIVCISPSLPYSQKL